MQLGISSVEMLKEALGSDVDGANKPAQCALQKPPEKYHNKQIPEDGSQEEEKLVYTDSSTFLKGTQSSNPHNDYCQHFVDTGQRPQNFIRDVGLADRYKSLNK